MYISRFSGAPLFPYTRKAGEGPEGWVAFSPGDAEAGDEAGDEADSSARMLQHVRTATVPSAGSGSVRTELFDALSCGPTIGYAMGSPAGPTAGPLQAREAQLLLVEASSLLWVPRGARPPAALPLPAAPAIRSLLEAAPEWLGVAYAITLAGVPLPLRPRHAHSRLVTGRRLTATPSRVLVGGPSSAVCDALAALPGVLEARSGLTGRAGWQGPPPTSAVWSDCTGELAGELGLVEAVQLAVDPRVALEGLLEAFWAIPNLPGEWRGSEGAGTRPPAIFYHSWAQRDAALRWRSRRQQTERVTVNLLPANTFWVGGPEEQRTP